MREKIKKIIPEYAWFPLIFTAFFNLFVFYGSRVLTWTRFHHIVELPVDQMIPFWPPAIIIYASAFAQWLIGYVVIARDSKEACDKVLGAEFTAKVICFTIFLIFPTTNIRPEVTGHGLIPWGMRFMYMVDAPRQLFPSIHCLDSYMVWRGISRMKNKPPKAYQVGMLVLTLGVFAATLMTRQHVIVDVFGGVLVAELGLLLGKVLKAERIFDGMRAVVRRNQKRIPNGN